jgi:hypothetical protein
MPLITPHPGKLGAGNKGCETSLRSSLSLLSTHQGQSFSMAISLVS